MSSWHISLGISIDGSSLTSSDIRIAKVDPSRHLLGKCRSRHQLCTSGKLVILDRFSEVSDNQCSYLLCW